MKKVNDILVAIAVVMFIAVCLTGIFSGVKYISISNHKCINNELYQIYGDSYVKTDKICVPK